ncbi:hypothetical protein Tco_1531166 [Tanacetum coccineum]
MPTITQLLPQPAVHTQQLIPALTNVDVKARFSGNEESKKMKKTMLKQQFAEFFVTEEEGLHKGYDRFQKISESVNQKSLELDDRIVIVMSESCCCPTHSAFIGTTSSGLKPTYSDQQHTVPSVSQTSGRSDNLIEFDDKARYSAFKVTEVKTDEPKALVSVNSMVNWSDHAAENKTELKWPDYQDNFGVMKCRFVPHLVSLLRPCEKDLKPLYSRFLSHFKSKAASVPAVVKKFTPAFSYCWLDTDPSCSVETTILSIHSAERPQFPTGTRVLLLRLSRFTLGLNKKTTFLSSKVIGGSHPIHDGFTLKDPQGKLKSIGLGPLKCTNGFVVLFCSYPSTDNDKDQGMLVKFGGEIGRITGKHHTTSKELDLENVYYVEEQQTF